MGDPRPAFCVEPDCMRAPRPGGTQCSAHYMRSLRGSASRLPIRARLTPFQYLIEACIALADAEEHEDFDAAKARTRAAAQAWLRSLGWRRPVRAAKKRGRGAR